MLKPLGEYIVGHVRACQPVRVDSMKAWLVDQVPGVEWDNVHTLFAEALPTIKNVVGINDDGDLDLAENCGPDILDMRH